MEKLSDAQEAQIKEHLALVFNKVTSQINQPTESVRPKRHDNAKRLCSFSSTLYNTNIPSEVSRSENPEQIFCSSLPELSLLTIPNPPITC